jgi:carbon-monoxide dehydrogenase large subunit
MTDTTVREKSNAAKSTPSAKPAGPLGARLERKEDMRFLTGAGQYTDDVKLANQSYACFLRSPHAHARIKSIDTKKAAAAPGVLAVYTGNDTAAVGGLPCGWLITGTDGKPMKEPKHPILAQDRVRYVGQEVALVIAYTLDLARAAAELVEVDYEPLPSVVDVRDAMKKGAVAVHDEAPDNV